MIHIWVHQYIIAHVNTNKMLLLTWWRWQWLQLNCFFLLLFTSFVYCTLVNCCCCASFSLSFYEFFFQFNFVFCIVFLFVISNFTASELNNQDEKELRMRIKHIYTIYRVKKDNNKNNLSKILLRNTFNKFCLHKYTWMLAWMKVYTIKVHTLN